MLNLHEFPPAQTWNEQVSQDIWVKAKRPSWLPFITSGSNSICDLILFTWAVISESYRKLLVKLFLMNNPMLQMNNLFTFLWKHTCSQNNTAAKTDVTSESLGSNMAIFFAKFLCVCVCVFVCVVSCGFSLSQFATSALWPCWQALAAMPCKTTRRGKCRKRRSGWKLSTVAHLGQLLSLLDGQGQVAMTTAKQPWHREELNTFIF